MRSTLWILLISNLITLSHFRWSTSSSQHFYHFKKVLDPIQPLKSSIHSKTIHKLRRLLIQVQSFRFHSESTNLSIEISRKNANKTLDNPETSLIEVVESVYGEPSTFHDSDNGESSQKRKAENEIWFSETGQECENFYAKDYVIESNNVDPNLDATDLLFLSYAKTLKSFSPRHQVQVKMKLSELMGQAELDELNDKIVESDHVDSSDNSIKKESLRETNEADSSKREKIKRSKS